MMIRAYSSWKSKIQYLKILEYLNLSFIKWPSLKDKFRASLVLWNHNNGEDCWLGNGPEDNHWHLHKEDKSQKVISRVGYRSHLNRYGTGIGTWNSVPVPNGTFFRYFTLCVITKTFISVKK